jgi:hemoglobin/transferrin/lactoferrin receptor protein
LFLEDGLRLNNPRRQTDFGEITGLVSLEDVARAEVVRGPASVLYGTDAIGGVLNLVSKAPAYDQGFRASASLGWRGAGEQTVGSAVVSGRHDRFSYRLGYGRRDGDDYEAPSGRFGDIELSESVTVNDTRLEDQHGSAFFGFDVDDSNQLALRWTRYRAEETGFGFVEPEAYGVEEAFRIRILYPYQDFDRVALRWEGAGFDSLVANSVRLQVYGQRNERRLVNDIDIDIGPLFPGAPNSSVTSDTDNFTELETVGLRADAVRNLGNSQLLTWGVEGYQDQSRNTDSSVTVTTLRFPFPPFQFIDTTVDTLANAPNATNESISFFAQDEWFASERLTVTGGLRWQRVSTKADATPGWDTSGLDFEDDAVVGSLSAAFGLTDTLRVVAGAGTAFRAPSLIERLFNGPTPEGAGFQILNPELESERSEALDLGLKYLSGNAFAELVVFRNEIKDGVIQAFFSPAEIAALPQDLRERIEASGADFVVQQQNADRLRYEGVELAGGWRSRSGLVLEGNYTYLDGERIDSTNPPTGDQASSRLVGSVRYEPTSSRWWAEYRVRWQDRQRANLDPDEPLPPVGAFLPSFTVHQIGAGYTFYQQGNQRHGLQLLIDNVTDELYAEASNTTFFRPQPGREVSLTWRSSF